MPGDRKPIWQTLKALKPGDSIGRETGDVLRVGRFVE